MPTKSFEYLDKEVVYLDHACQSLRPSSVIEAELKYYTNYNSCAGRGNNYFVEEVDKVIQSCRKEILRFVGKNSEQYSVVFCPNTTYGINLILTNLNWGSYSQILTTSKEHNSVFLPAISYAKKFQKKLNILKRQNNELDIFSLTNFNNTVAIFNTTSNIDGSGLKNLDIVINSLKKNNNLVLLDATQTLAHHQLNLIDVDFDCIFASGHKLYAPSIGFMIIKKSLIKNLDQFWVGGGTVQRVAPDSYELINYEGDIGSRLEFGLQDYAAIYGLEQALKWLRNYRIKNEYPKLDYDSNLARSLSERIMGFGPSTEAIYYIDNLSEVLFENMEMLVNAGKLKLLNKESSSIISFIPVNIDSYSLNSKLSDFGIMCRSGYMCAHNYIREELRLPPIIRASLGLHNTPRDIMLFLNRLVDLLS